MLFPFLLLGGRHCGASMRPGWHSEKGAGGKRRGWILKAANADHKNPRRPFLGETACGGTEKGLAPAPRCARDAAESRPAYWRPEKGRGERLHVTRRSVLGRTSAR